MTNSDSAITAPPTRSRRWVLPSVVALVLVAAGGAYLQWRQPNPATAGSASETKHACETINGPQGTWTVKVAVSGGHSPRPLSWTMRGGDVSLWYVVTDHSGVTLFWESGAGATASLASVPVDVVDRGAHSITVQGAGSGSSTVATMTVDEVHSVAGSVPLATGSIQACKVD